MSIEGEFRSELLKWGLREIPTDRAVCAFASPDGDEVSLDIDRPYNLFAIFVRPHGMEKEYQLGFIMEAAALQEECSAEDTTLEGQLNFLKELLRDCKNCVLRLDAAYSSVRENHRIF